MNHLESTKNFLGIGSETVSAPEKLVSTLGGVIGISLIALISYRVTGAAGAALIVPSMGASAVLLFAVPHGRLSQPWSLFGGHLISAIIGVTCYQFIPGLFLAAGLAVGLSIGAMHFLRCIHPPGGATALAAVIGGPAIHVLGYEYVIDPILLNSVIIFLVAVIFNGFFPWRRYPVSMMRFTDTLTGPQKGYSRFIDKKYIDQAIADMDLVVDVATDDLQRLFALTMEHADGCILSAIQIQLGHYYTNGKHGEGWSVRQIIDESPSLKPENDMVIYRVVEGHGMRSADSCTRQEFANWTVREVAPAGKD